MGSDSGGPSTRAAWLVTEQSPPTPQRSSPARNDVGKPSVSVPVPCQLAEIRSHGWCAYSVYITCSVPLGPSSVAATRLRMGPLSTTLMSGVAIKGRPSCRACSHGPETGMKTLSTCIRVIAPRSLSSMRTRPLSRHCSLTSQCRRQLDRRGRLRDGAREVLASGALTTADRAPLRSLERDAQHHFAGHERPKATHLPDRVKDGGDAGHR